MLLLKKEFARQPTFYMLIFQFFITLRDGLQYLDGQHTVIGEVSEGLDVITKINEAYCDEEHRPYKDIR